MRLGIFLIALFLNPATPVRGQVIELRERPTCGNCRIVYEIRDTLGNIHDPASPGFVANALRLSDGRILVSSDTFGGQVFVYAPSGELDTMLGARGEGPGEFSGLVKMVALQSDTVALLDGGLGRISILAPDGSFISSINLGLRPTAFASRPSGGFVVSGGKPEGRNVAAMHFFSRGGALEMSFARVATDEWDPARARLVTVATGGQIWASEIVGGRLEEWSPTGELQTAFQIMNPDLQWRAALERLPAQVWGLALDASGYLWIHLLVPDRRFQPSRNGGTRPTMEDLYNTRILIVDPLERVVTAIGEFEGIVRPLAAGWAYDLVDTELGDRQVRLGVLRVEGLQDPL